jgi:hypothetical protein
MFSLQGECFCPSDLSFKKVQFYIGFSYFNKKRATPAFYRPGCSFLMRLSIGSRQGSIDSFYFIGYCHSLPPTNSLKHPAPFDSYSTVSPNPRISWLKQKLSRRSPRKTSNYYRFPFLCVNYKHWRPTKYG